MEIMETTLGIHQTFKVLATTLVMEVVHQTLVTTLVARLTTIHQTMGT